jgi:stage II sporulation protein AA (anti-sigma F factor antagonist)
MQKDVNFSELGEELVAGLSGELDHHSAKKMRIEIDSMLFRIKPKILALDFSLVRFMDSSGIGFIIGRKRSLQETQAELVIENPNTYIFKHLKCAGLDKIIKIVNSK